MSTLIELSARVAFHARLKCGPTVGQVVGHVPMQEANADRT